jgi:hypothetical protein
MTAPFVQDDVIVGRKPIMSKTGEVIGMSYEISEESNKSLTIPGDAMRRLVAECDGRFQPQDEPSAWPWLLMLAASFAAGFVACLVVGGMLR